MSAGRGFFEREMRMAAAAAAAASICFAWSKECFGVAVGLTSQMMSGPNQHAQRWYK